MAAAQCSRRLDAPPPSRPRFISSDLVPRTFYFPPATLARLEQKPGDLVELLTVLLSAHLKGGAH